MRKNFTTEIILRKGTRQAAAGSEPVLQLKERLFHEMVRTPRHSRLNTKAKKLRIIVNIH
jgi:hypothetical protein